LSVAPPRVRQFQTSLRELQHLLGHRSQQTTEIYLKSLVPETVRPNERPIIAKAT
jgi:integrase